MDFNIINFENTYEKWDEKILNLEGSLHLVTKNSINFYSAFDNIINKSFLIEFENEILAAVPLAINTGLKKNFYGFSYNYCPSPVFKKNLKPSKRRKIWNIIIDHISNIDKDIKQLHFFSHPISMEITTEINSKNQFEILNFTKHLSVINTFIIDLSLDQNILIQNLSKFHKRNIFKHQDLLKFNVYTNENIKKLKNKFNEFKDLHLKSAGKLTRPLKTWELMFQDLLENKATLFSVSIKDKDKDISYLYCGQYKKFAWGFSQVNNNDFEKEYMPRHVLEWLVILYFKNQKYKFYELGEDHNIFFGNFSEKEKSISSFKEKYGSYIYPKAYFKIDL